MAGREPDPGRERDDLGGDPVCWLDRVCPECGLFLEDTDGPCPRCGRTDGPERPGGGAHTDPLPSRR